MKKSYIKIFTSFIIVGLLAAGCTATGKKKSSKVFKHNTPLIKTDVKEMGKAEIDKMAEMGPTPVEGDVVKLKKRKKLNKKARKKILDSNLTLSSIGPIENLEAAELVKRRIS